MSSTLYVPRYVLIKLTISRFEKGAAILKTEDNNTVVWPENKLPKDVQPGSVLLFNIFGDAVSKGDNQNLAKEILNEILDC